MTRQTSILTRSIGQGGQAMWLMTAAIVLFILQALPALARGAPESFADLAEQVSPSVVNITTSTTVAGRAGPPQGVVPEGSPFEDFFRDFQERNQPGQRPRRSSALGSGFVISADGFIVTNNHVIEGADEISVEFFSGEELPATLIGRDPAVDIALLKVESDDPLPFVAFGDSDVARVGDWVMAVGNPLGQGFSVSAGIVSARNRALQGQYDDYIQTDAAINRGNSGGPLFNMEGEVIGVNTAILSPNGGSIGIGFSMASNVVTRVVDQLQEFGETRRGWLGVRIQDVTDDIADSIAGLETAAGALVTDVPPGPAAEAGILAGDLILSFDGRTVADTRELVRTVGNTAVGKAVDVIVLRDGAEQTLSVTLGRRETAEAAARPASAPAPEPVEKTVLGLTLTALTDDMKSEMELAPNLEGLLIKEVREDSDAFEKGLRAGDVITQAGQQDVDTLDAFEARISETKDAGRKSLLLLVRRAGEPRFVALPIS
jgi:serine protease Do